MKPLSLRNGIPRLSLGMTVGGWLSIKKGRDNAPPPTFNSCSKVTPLFCSSLCHRSPANQTMVSFLDRGRVVATVRHTNRVSPDPGKDLLSTFPHSKPAFPPRFSVSRCDRPISRFHHRSRRSRRTL